MVKMFVFKNSFNFKVGDNEDCSGVVIYSTRVVVFMVYSSIN